MAGLSIKVENVSKKYQLGRNTSMTFRGSISNLFSNKKEVEDFWALRGVSFDLKQGDVLGIIGKNGAGKSTLLKILSKITSPTTGKIEFYGKVSSLLEVGTGFHPELTGKENIFLNGSILGMSNREIKENLDEIIAFSGVEKFIDTPVKKYSSGMYVRLAFSVAAHLRSDILLIDEVLAVGDNEFRKKCMAKMDDIHNSGKTIIFVSHNMNAIRNICDRTLLLENGKIKSLGDTDVIINSYLNETTSPVDEISSRLIKGVKIYGENESSEIISGGVLNILFYCKNFQSNSTNTIMRVEVYNHFMELLFICNNRVNGDTINIEEQESSIRLRIQDVPLMSGKYFIKYFIKADGRETDTNLQFIPFVVYNNNFYPTGLEPTSKKGILLNYRYVNS
jgi:lipopolysaccharide transport system ATP-binding protein